MTKILTAHPRDRSLHSVPDNIRSPILSELGARVEWGVDKLWDKKELLSSTDLTEDDLSGGLKYARIMVNLSEVFSVSPYINVLSELAERSLTVTDLHQATSGVSHH